ncbi:hypothetical protein GOP47_0014754 [Adiantum capillus-veneris]|uniref:Uncharacterized protein n=1 Tax=Adiantum capillus-veneris TaxID=13818 RepID=A0A9D4UMU2_ADICA|nr:hypothetical protein GOP47_0014754 [Adiantum capillus-veneris]
MRRVPTSKVSKCRRAATQYARLAKQRNVPTCGAASREGVDHHARQKRAIKTGSFGLAREEAFMSSALQREVEEIRM